MTGLDLGAIGNCRINALIDRRGRIVWSCFPRPDGDPVFCSLLGGAGEAEGGFLDVAVEGVTRAEQRYRDNTAILVTELTTGAGNGVRITDFAPRFKQFDRMYRPAMIIRRIEPMGGALPVRIRMRPRFDYGAVPPRVTLGSNHLRFEGPATTLRLTTDAPVSSIREERAFLLDGPVHLLIGTDESLTASIRETARTFEERTEEYWQEWVRYLSVPYEWQVAVIRAAITLKLCSFEETGAILAAMTTSVPESANSGRTWDYRYCWLRDAFFVVQALNRLGATRTMEDFIRYVTNVAAIEPPGQLKPVYSILPEETIREASIASLPGYRGMGPVRRGNDAVLQDQHDSYGNVILAAAQMFFDHRLPRRGGEDLFRLLERIGTEAAARAYTPDSGLWEFRGRTRTHTFSSVMCWAACDRLAKIAGVLGLVDRAAHWRDTAAKIRTTILERGFDRSRNSFVESFEGKDLDASLLLLHEVGFIRPDDPRYLGTIAAIESELKHGNMLLRYAAPDDFGAPETAFTICTFWYVDALGAVGRREEARAIFSSVLERRNHVGLLSEDIDVKTGELWGNFPQTFSMVGMIVSAMRLSMSWEEAFWRGSS